MRGQKAFVFCVIPHYRFHISTCGLWNLGPEGPTLLMELDKKELKDTVDFPHCGSAFRTQVSLLAWSGRLEFLHASRSF